MKTRTVIALCVGIATTCYARLGQNQFSIESQLNKKFPMPKHTDTRKQVYSGQLTFSNITLSIHFRGEAYMPMNVLKYSDYRYARNDTKLPFEYKSYKSVKEEILFKTAVSKEIALKYVLKLLPKTVKKYSKVDSMNFIARDYSRLIHITLSPIEVNGEQKIQKLTVEYDKQQMDTTHQKNWDKLYSELIKRAQRSHRARY